PGCKSFVVKQDTLVWNGSTSCEITTIAKLGNTWWLKGHCSDKGGMSYVGDFRFCETRLSDERLLVVLTPLTSRWRARRTRSSQLHASQHSRVLACGLHGAPRYGRRRRHWPARRRQPNSVACIYLGCMTARAAPALRLVRPGRWFAHHSVIFWFFQTSDAHTARR